MTRKPWRGRWNGQRRDSSIPLASPSRAVGFQKEFSLWKWRHKCSDFTFIMLYSFPLTFTFYLHDKSVMAAGKYCYPYLSKKEIKDPVRSCVLAEFRELIRNDNCTRTMNVWIGTGLIAHSWKQIEWEKNRTSDLIYFQAFKVQVSAEMWSAGSRGKNETTPGPPKFTARILKLGVLFRVFQKQTQIQGPNTNRPNARSLTGRWCSQENTS